MQILVSLTLPLRVRPLLGVYVWRSEMKGVTG